MSLASWDEWIARFAPGSANPVRGLRLDRAFMTLNAADNGLGMCIERSVLVHDYLRLGRLVAPFGALAIDATAHWLSVLRSKEGLQAVGTVVEWIKGFADWENEPDAPG